ncbi:hypothetical protein QCA50_006311 [Cerrena zonata]|uniref:non-specific serine/threonine protein kinase n=1 Tax=Cerrena zonata TaxID=2478898 RepID=A0AAW0GCE3_9APHY
MGRHTRALTTSTPTNATFATSSARTFHPIKLGEVFCERYEVINQLGSGVYSQVLLVRDIRENRLAAMKVLVSELTRETRGPDERGIMMLLRDTDPQSIGWHHVCQLFDSFTHTGPNGEHICLILEPLRLGMGSVSRAFNGPMPLPLVRRIAKQMLQALQYVHKCGVIHTDIKPDNIMMVGPPPTAGQTSTQININDLQSANFKLIDFGSANTLARRWAAVLQPLALRAPEVIVGADWDTKVDVWNLSCLLYEFVRGAILFDPNWNNEITGMNQAQTHLAQMVGLFGSFPHDLLQRSRRTAEFLDNQGNLLRPGSYSITLQDLLARTKLASQEVDEVSDFLLRGLTIDPKLRWSAAQLLEHPWLRLLG